MTDKVEVERKDLERLVDLAFRYLDAAGFHMPPTISGRHVLSRHENELLEIRKKYLGDSDD